VKWGWALIWLFPLSALACLRLEGEALINATEIKISQKVSRGQTYSFAKDNYLVNISLPAEKQNQIQYEVLRKDAGKLTPLAAGDLLIAPGKTVSARTEDQKNTTSITIELKDI
jgi:hypothetical protein